jgi:hypothetical protein
VADAVIAGCLGLAALIHLLPLVGVLSPARVAALYDVPVAGPDLAVLLRHRAVLFGLLGGLLAWAAFDESLRAPALVFALVSDLGYAVLCLIHRDHNAALRRVLLADLVSIVALGAASVLAVTA